jgi:hypothetical protein
LGGHRYECDHCGARHILYNSCRNRHCPKCQNLDKERWLEKRANELLPVPYFHIAFTLPEELNPLILRNQRCLYDLLFRCASETLLEIAADPDHLGARIGILAVLHTWSQQLTEHPHVHCIVPGGGLSLDRQRWIHSRPGFFLPVRVLSRLFRGKFLHRLKALYQEGKLVFPGTIQTLQSPAAFHALLNQAFAKEWVVYSKAPFGGPEHVLRYLARYTHRVAISNHRLLRLEGDRVVFSYRDSAHGNRRREKTLSADEFIRRFLLHILPHRFVRIRSYGILAPRSRKRDLTLCQNLLAKTPLAVEPQPKPRESWSDLLYRLTGIDPLRCQTCGEGRMHSVCDILPERTPSARDPP